MPNCVHGIDSRFCATCAKPRGRQDSIRAKAARRNPNNEAEREAFEAVYAYEEAISNQRGKKIAASRTWQMITRHGIIDAVERIVTRRAVTTGYRVLVEMGLERMAFESVVLRHPEAFSAEAVAAAKARLVEAALMS